MENSVWKRISVHAVGGLIQVGFAEQSDLLLVLSHDGRGIFNCLTGEKIARNRNDSQEFFDKETSVAKGFDLLESKEIKTAGLYGGTLSEKTQDGWKLSTLESKGICRIYLNFKDSDNVKFIADDEVAEIRAIGFSETEQTFVVATNADLTIFSRHL